MEVTTPPVQTTFGTEHVMFLRKTFKFTAVGATVSRELSEEVYEHILQCHTSSRRHGRGI